MLMKCVIVLDENYDLKYHPVNTRAQTSMESTNNELNK
jgi:hypothetical protein